jgi:hypothetical protein
MAGRIVLPVRRRGELVEFATAPLACGHGAVRVRLAVGPAIRRCEVCKRASLLEIHRSAIQEAWIVDPAVVVGQMTFAEALEPPRAGTKRRRPTQG